MLQSSRMPPARLGDAGGAEPLHRHPHPLGVVAVRPVLRRATGRDPRRRSRACRLDRIRAFVPRPARRAGGNAAAHPATGRRAAVRPIFPPHAALRTAGRAHQHLFRSRGSLTLPFVSKNAVACRIREVRSQQNPRLPLFKMVIEVRILNGQIPYTCDALQRIGTSCAH